MGKRGPKAKPAAETKSAPLSLRLHPDLRDKLQAAADQSGHYLSSEISLRLAGSLEYGKRVSEAFGNERNFMLMQMIAAPLKRSETWLDDPREFDRCLQSIIDLLETIRPSGPRSQRDQALQMLSSEFGHGVVADATWAIIKDADTSKPRHLRSDLDHFAINAKRILGSLVDRADPLLRSREIAKTTLSSAFPDEDFSNMPDDQLFERHEALINQEQERFVKAMNEPPPYDHSLEEKENG